MKFAFDLHILTSFAPVTLEKIFFFPSNICITGQLVKVYVFLSLNLQSL